MSTLQTAIEIAVRAHAGQFQKSPADEPYITHPLGVMARVEGLETKIVAVLHDVLEDTQVSASELRAAGFSERVLHALELLTRRKEDSYGEFILRCAADPLAVKVKLADLEHNFNLPRALIRAESVEWDIRRFGHYAAAHRFLSGSMSRDEFVAIMERLEKDMSRSLPAGITATERIP